MCTPHMPPFCALNRRIQGIPAHLDQPAAPPAAAPAAQPVAQPAAPAAQPAPAVQPAAAQPQNLFQLAQQQQQQHHAPGAGAGIPGLGATAGAGAAGAAGGANLAALANHPQIQHLREMMMQNPALAQTVIQELAQANPGLAQLFGQNPDALAQVLGGEFGDDEEGQVPPGAHVVHVTPEERAAIERVRAV